MYTETHTIVSQSQHSCEASSDVGMHIHSRPSDLTVKAVHISLTFSCWGKQLFDSRVDGTS